ncbi:MAG: hypothetical protein ABGZ24_04510, partial [Fuerstiella sp.]
MTIRTRLRTQAERPVRQRIKSVITGCIIHTQRDGGGLISINRGIIDAGDSYSLWGVPVGECEYERLPVGHSFFRIKAADCQHDVGKRLTGENNIPYVRRAGFVNGGGTA